MPVTRSKGGKRIRSKSGRIDSLSGQLLYFIFNKPYGVLSQFTDSEGRRTLAEFGSFPSDVYPVGRLDSDSEGMLILTNDGPLKHALLDPHFGHPRTYLVQIERIPDVNALELLRAGVQLEGKRTAPARVRLLEGEPFLPPRPVPIRFRKNVPTAWMEMILFEGRNRQVRRMTAAVGHPTLRLIRVKIGGLSLGDLQPGEVRSLNTADVAALRMRETLQTEEL